MKLSNSFARISHNQMFEVRSQIAEILSEDEIMSSSSQAALSTKIDKIQFQSLFEDADETNKARLLAVKMPHASDFLFAPPIASLGLKLTSDEWSAAVAYKLGLNFNSTTYKCLSKGCNQMMDRQALHALRCGTEGARLKRHNNIKKFLFLSCQRACLEPDEEPKRLIRNCGLKPADFGIPDYRPGKYMAYDVAVTDPTQKAFVNYSSSISGYGAFTYAQKKVEKYSEALAQDDSVELTPLIAETYGGWNKEAHSFFSMLSSWLSPRVSYKSKDIILKDIYQRLSVILQRGNARMLLARILHDI
jgi:hypothetical protein